MLFFSGFGRQTLIGSKKVKDKFPSRFPSRFSSRLLSRFPFRFPTGLPPGFSSVCHMPVIYYGAGSLGSNLI